MKQLLFISFLLLISIVGFTQPVVFRSTSYFGEACEYVNNQRKCTSVGMTKGKKNVFIIFTDRIEWATTTSKGVYHINKVDTSDKALTSYLTQDQTGEKFVFNLKANGKLLAVLSSYATLTYISEQ